LGEVCKLETDINMAVRRYVRYIQYMIQKGCQGYDALQSPSITINNISITKLPEAGGYPWFLDVVIEEGGNVVYNLAR
jgi:hypothetical protein